MTKRKDSPKKNFPKWFRVNDDGTVTIAWKGYTQFHKFSDIDTALRQTIHILENYGNQRIVIGDKTIIILGKIAELKEFKNITQKTLRFLKSKSMDLDIGTQIQKQIATCQKEITANLDTEIEKDLKIYFAVMKRGVIIKKEIIRSQKIIVNVCKELVKSYQLLEDCPLEYNVQRIKNQISGKGPNLINGFKTIVVNPYKRRVNLPSVKRLENISNIGSPKQLQKIIKNAFNRLIPVIPESEIKSEIFFG